MIREFVKDRHRNPICNFKFYILSAAIVTLCIAWLPAANEEINDSKIAQAVDAQLLVDDVVLSHVIDTRVYDGIVTLSGTVDTLLVRERALEIARRVKGVRAVIDRMDVKRSQSSDEEIQKNVLASLFRDPATESYEINVTVKGGKIWLQGEVDSWQEKDLAEKVAMDVAGVRDIENNIQVDYAMSRPDSEIEAEITKIMDWDIHVDNALINVTVNDGKVVLSGTVGSALEKSHATHKSWVAGVTAVDNSNLNVELWARDENLREGKYVVRTDDEIRQAVQDAFLYDPRVNSFDPQVEVSQGTVTLIGTVDNLKAKVAAEQDAKNTLGIWRVKNLLKVRPLDLKTDDTIERDVETAFSRNALLDRHEIDVVSINRKVYLSGTVDSDYERTRATDVAARVAGVVEIQNNLDVRGFLPSRRTAETYTKKSDWEIREDIEDEFFWSPFVNGDDIDVKVEDGVATLTGTVGSWSEREAATENALEGGAIAVTNRLLVEYGPPVS